MNVRYFSYNIKLWPPFPFFKGGGHEDINYYQEHKKYYGAELKEK